MGSIGVIGTGTWGTALASLLAIQHEEHRIILWGRRTELVTTLTVARVHPNLKMAVIPDRLEITADPQALQTADLLFWAVPTQHSRSIALLLAKTLSCSVPLVSLTKGLELETLKTPTAILAEVLGANRPLGALSGPSHAEEVIRTLPTGLVMAGPVDLRQRVQELLHGRRLRIYGSDDLVGVELAAALKNVIAIAAGIIDGLGLGDNLKATIVTRGLAEIRRLGRKLGARDQTFAGLAGIGDLLTTCYSQHSRNRGLGQAIGRGESFSSFCERTGMVAEGAWTSRSALILAAHHGVEMPLSTEVANVLWNGASVANATESLITRSAKEEDL